MIPILLLAAALRFHKLDSIPPGMTHDEGSIGFFVKQVAENTGFRIDAPYGYANEPLTKYSAALMFWLLGARDWTLRAHQAFWGLTAVLFGYLWVRRAFSVPIGVGTAALLAVAYWPMSTSRMALNSNPLPGLTAAAAYFLWRGLFGASKANRLAWLGFVSALVLSLFTYEAARTTWAAFPIFGLYIFIFHRQRIEIKRIGMLVGAIIAATIIALPHLLNPAAWGRTGTLAEPLRALQSGNIAPLLQNASEGIGSLLWKGDPFVVYNLPGRPVFGPIFGALFIAGVLFCIWKWRNPPYAFALLWLGFGLIPTLVIGAFTATLHSIAAQVVIFVFPMIAMANAIDWLSHRLPNWRLRRIGWTALAIGVGLTGVTSAHDYFNTWANSGELRAAYFANFGAMTRAIDELDLAGNVTLSSPFPDLPHDPFVYDLRVTRDDLDVRWFDARAALVFPNTERSTLFIPVHAYPNEDFQTWLSLEESTRVIVRSSDIDPWFDVVQWNPIATLENWLATPEIRKLNEPFSVADSPAIRLIAYAQNESAIYPDKILRLLTFWEIIDPLALGPRELTEYNQRANIFVHIFDRDGEIISQHDTLQAPAWDWRTGETFVQRHQLPIPNEIPPGKYALRIGIFMLPSLNNLHTETGAEFVLLDPVEIAKP